MSYIKIYLNIKITASTTMVGFRFSHLRAMVFSATYEMMPSRMPSLIELAIAIENSVMKQGSPSSYELKSMYTTRINIIKPTIISAGLVAADGMAKKSGEKNKETTKSMAMENAVNPVRPPSPTPAADST